MNSIYKKSDLGLEDSKKLADTRLCIAYGRSGVGGRSENQDCYGGAHLDDNVVLTVCDGMGGMNGGQTASHIAVTEILQSIIEYPKEKWGEDLIVKAVNNANAAIYRKSVAEPSLRGMGTTATVLILTPEAAFLTHVGDSRIYQLRRGKKIFRTFDHSRVFEMVSQKMITEEQARTSSFSNVITRALGIRPSVEMTVEKIPYKKGDRFILCCDGIWNCEPESNIIEYFDKKDTPGREIKYLTETINGIGIGSGGNHDNLTAIVADIVSNSKYQYSILKPLHAMWNKMFEKKNIEKAEVSNKTNN